jgi:hypothetical protein
VSATATHYEVLGVSQDASHDEVKRAFLDHALQWHPARVAADDLDAVETARWRMGEINAAWEVLRSPSARAAYDSSIDGQRSPGDGAPGTAGVSSPHVDPGVDLTRAVLLQERAEPDIVTRRDPPWAWLLAGLAVVVGVLVLSAVARQQDEPVGVETRERFGVGSCVASEPSGGWVEVACDGDHSAVVEARRTFPASCPVTTRAELLVDQRTILCLGAVREAAG